jgi:Na+/phosphate symporter
MTWKIVKWLSWILLASFLIFGGWMVKDRYSHELGKSIMGIGWILAGFLIIYAAYQNLKHETKNQTHRGNSGSEPGA